MSQSTKRRYPSKNGQKAEVEDTGGGIYRKLKMQEVKNTGSEGYRKWGFRHPLLQ